MEAIENSEKKINLDGFADPTEVRKTILGMLYSGQASHLGTNMSAVEMLISIYGSITNEFCSISISMSVFTLLKLLIPFHSCQCFH